MLKKITVHGLSPLIGLLVLSAGIEGREDTPINWDPLEEPGEQ